jgi:hypothetical protein
MTLPAEPRAGEHVIPAGTLQGLIEAWKNSSSA